MPTLFDSIVQYLSGSSDDVLEHELRSSLKDSPDRRRLRRNRNQWAVVGRSGDQYAMEVVEGRGRFDAAVRMDQAGADETAMVEVDPVYREAMLRSRSGPVPRGTVGEGFSERKRRAAWLYYDRESRNERLTDLQRLVMLQNAKNFER